MTDNLTPAERAARGYAHGDADAIARIDARAAARAATEADIANGRSPFVARPQPPTAADRAVWGGHDSTAARREADRARDIARARQPLLSDEERRRYERMTELSGNAQDAHVAASARVTLAQDRETRAARERLGITDEGGQ